MQAYTISWEWALLLRVFIGLGLCQGILIKYVATQGRRIERFFLQYLFTLMLALAVAAAQWDSVRLDGWFLVCAIVGMLGAAGAYFQWKAVAISQTRTSLFTFWDDIIAMALAVAILGEMSFLGPAVSLGIGLSFVSLALCIRHSWLKKKSKAGQEGDAPLRLYGYIAIYSVLWGVAFFAQRYWSFRSFPLATFLCAWYVGAFITAAFMRLAFPTSDEPGIGARGIALVFLLSLGLFASMGVSVLSYQAPQVVVQPIFFVAEMVVPAAFGVVLWRERLDRKEWLYYGVGFVGALMIGLSFK